MHDIRASLVSGEGLRRPGPVAVKKAKVEGERNGSLAAVAISRTESRVSDHRREGREYDLIQEATLIHRRRKHAADVVNISPSGVMIRCAAELRIGAAVELQIADCNRMRGVVRWLRDDRFGIEFDAQTDIVTTGRNRAAILAAHQPAAAAMEKGQSMVSRSARHGLVWNGTLYWTFEAFNVRLRNISAGGALMDCDRALPQGAPVRLNVSDAGTFAGEVRWSSGGQVGIKFDLPFDVRVLVSAQPVKQERIDRMLTPAYLRTETQPDSPWAARWEKLHPDDFKRG